MHAKVLLAFQNHAVTASGAAFLHASLGPANHFFVGVAVADFRASDGQGDG